MPNYTKFKIEAQRDHTQFKVLVRGWFGIWKCGYVHTNYFSIIYPSENEAAVAIERYKKRFTEH